MGSEGEKNRDIVVGMLIIPGLALGVAGYIYLHGLTQGVQAQKSLTNLTVTELNVCKDTDSLDPPEGSVTVEETIGVGVSAAEVVVFLDNQVGVQQTSPIEESQRVATINIGEVAAHQVKKVSFEAERSLSVGAPLEAIVNVIEGPPDGNPLDDTKEGSVHGWPCRIVGETFVIYLPAVFDN